MKIAIFGSCVSRDTCEFIPDSQVVAYVARHSVTSLNSPHGVDGIHVGELDSGFQRRMVLTDLKGIGLARLTNNAADLDLVLIDLVDERRGFWLWPDGTTMTNSLEIEVCGAGVVAAEQGARLVEFGTDEHFDAWTRGFETLIAGLLNAGLRDRTVLLDIEWARALDGASHPQDDLFSHVGRRWRKLQRGTREALRSRANGGGIVDALGKLRNVRPTEAEGFSDRAERANNDYLRYRRVASSAVAAVVTRVSSDLRIAPDHKWGPQPFHYRDEDYRSIVTSIGQLRSRLGKSSQ